MCGWTPTISWYLSDILLSPGHAYTLRKLLWKFLGQTQCSRENNLLYTDTKTLPWSQSHAFTDNGTILQDINSTNQSKLTGEHRRVAVCQGRLVEEGHRCHSALPNKSGSTTLSHNLNNTSSHYCFTATSLQ